MHINLSHWCFMSSYPAWIPGRCTQSIDSSYGRCEPWLDHTAKPTSQSEVTLLVSHQVQLCYSTKQGKILTLMIMKDCSPLLWPLKTGQQICLHHRRPVRNWDHQLIPILDLPGLSKTALCFICRTDDILFHWYILQCIGYYFIIWLGQTWGSWCPPLNSSRKFQFGTMLSVGSFQYTLV